MARRRLIGIVLTVVAAVAAVPAAVPAGPGGLGGAGTWRQTPQGYVLGDVEHVATIPFEGGGGVGAELLGTRLYTTTFRSFSIYDVADPLVPKLLSQIPLDGYLFNEEPDTDGEILLLTRDVPSPVLDIWDVSDPTAPARITTYALDRTDHMWTCVLSCRYAYGGRGTILDLADPANPKKVGDWAAGRTFAGFHAIEEIADGVVAVGAVPTLILDARKTPATPSLLTSVTPTTTQPGRPYVIIGQPRSLPASVGWPRERKDRWLLMAMETPLSGPCSGTSGGFRTYDTTNWEEGEPIRFVDELKITTNEGGYEAGQPPRTVWGCSSYAFDPHPSFKNKGPVAVAWFEHGLRLLDVDGEGQITERAGFLGFGAVASLPMWLTPEILYVVDIHRGIDVLRIPSS